MTFLCFAILFPNMQSFFSSFIENTWNSFSSSNLLFETSRNSILIKTESDKTDWILLEDKSRILRLTKCFNGETSDILFLNNPNVVRFVRLEIPFRSETKVSLIDNSLREVYLFRHTFLKFALFMYKSKSFWKHFSWWIWISYKFGHSSTSSISRLSAFSKPCREEKFWQ